MTVALEPDHRQLGSLDAAEANIATVRKAYDHAAAGDFERFFDDFADDAVGHDAEGLPYGGVFPGKDGVKTLCAKMFAAWEGVRWRVRAIAAGDDVVFVDLDMMFTPRGGDEIVHPVTERWRLVHGKVVEIRPFYYDTKQIAEILSAHP